MKHIIGEYKVSSEDTNKIYIEAKDKTETTSFYLNSSIISKSPIDSNEDYENIEISEPVINVDGKLYINAEGFMQGFNSTLTYDKTANNIEIQTLPYLIAYYKANISNFGYSNLSEDFNDQKALVYGMLVASKETTNKYGVVDIRTNKEILSPRYNNIEFIENSKEFIITNASEKVGIAYSTGETKIQVMYDEIKLIDNKLGYYLVKSNSKYGIINSNEEAIIHIEYDNIGINSADFPMDGIKNQYILYDSLIPVSLNGKWGLFDIEGKRVTEIEYDTIGCKNSEPQDRILNNVAIVGDSKVVVLSKDNVYGGISTKGDFLLPLMFEQIYSIQNNGEIVYYMIHGGKQYKVLDMINAMKERLGYKE